MADRGTIALDVDVVYSEQEEIIDFLRNRALKLGQENKRLMEENKALGLHVHELEERISSTRRGKRGADATDKGEA